MKVKLRVLKKVQKKTFLFDLFCSIFAEVDVFDFKGKTLESKKLESTKMEKNTFEKRTGVCIIKHYGSII